MLRSLPFIRVHPKDSSKQEMTSAGKLYKDLNAYYMNAIRILSSLLRNVSADDFDPVADFMQKMSVVLKLDNTYLLQYYNEIQQGKIIAGRELRKELRKLVEELENPLYRYD